MPRADRRAYTRHILNLAYDGLSVVDRRVWGADSDR